MFYQTHVYEIFRIRINAIKINKVLFFITKVKVENNVKLFEAVDRCTIKVKKLKLFILTEAYTLCLTRKNS